MSSVMHTLTYLIIRDVCTFHSREPLSNEFSGCTLLSAHVVEAENVRVYFVHDACSQEERTSKES